MKEYKDYKNIDEQIEYLKENKKIRVAPEEKKYFEQRNYIELINPYKELFCYGRNENNKHIYKDEISFSSILELNHLDDCICDSLSPLIRNFEKKFRNRLLLEICENYKNSDFNDQKGICYVEDIEQVLAGNNLSPIIGPNFSYKLKKNEGYVEEDPKQIEKKKDLLKKIKNIGTDEEAENHKTNLPIKNAIKSQGVAPFWLIMSVLNYGDLEILFTMQDRETQTKIMNHFKIGVEGAKNIFKFQGDIELIRRLRNTINHYSPIFPIILEEMTKKIEDHKIFKIICFLKKQESLFEGLRTNKIPNLNYKYEENKVFGIPLTSFNKKKFHLIEKIINQLNS